VAEPTVVTLPLGQVPAAYRIDVQIAVLTVPGVEMEPVDMGLMSAGFAQGCRARRPP
jgi:hypothetical protein